MDKQYNEFSKGLKKLIPTLDGKTEYVFQVLNVRSEGGRKIYPPASIKGTDMILDPDTEEAINIAYITAITPTGPESTKASNIQIGSIDFSPLAAGRLVLVHKRHQELFNFLYLMNNNASNKDKPWHIQPEGRYRYELLDEEGDALALIEAESRIQEAKNYVSTLDEADVRDVCKALNVPNYQAGGVNQLKLILYKKAELDPSLILTIDENVEAQTTAMINDFVRAGLIEVKDGMWIYSDTGKKLAAIPKSIDANAALYRHFNTQDGIEALQFLKQVYEAS